ncbi:MAG: hypothetical protein WD929_00120 [Steroidobacteraceae bacterium]
MLINNADGSVTFAEGTIDPGMSKAAFLKSPVGVKAEKWFANGSFETYRFFPESGITATTDFRDDRLLNVSILFNLPGDSKDGPTKEQELRRREKHDEWLRAELGEPPYRYDWGQVVSRFYHQHCESDIMVIYEP